MSYLGGKARCAEFILRVLNDPHFDGRDFVEPMVGMAHILHRVRNKRSYAASDAHPLLITLLRAVQAGTPLPTHISKARYEELKRADGVNTLERACAAFQWSFNGKCFGGYTASYTRPNGRVDDIPKSRVNHYRTLHQAPSFRDSTLTACDYRALSPPNNALVYVDPPYEGRTAYEGVPPFDHEAFWRTMREWSKVCVVLISEYRAPADFVGIASTSKPSCFAGGEHQTLRTERLFAHISALPRLPPRLRPLPKPLYRSTAIRSTAIRPAELRPANPHPTKPHPDANRLLRTLLKRC